MISSTFGKTWYVIKGKVYDSDSINYTDPYFQNTSVIGSFLSVQDALDYIEKNKCAKSTHTSTEATIRL